MRRFFLFLSFALLSSMIAYSAQAAVWYSQNFDGLADGDVFGQDSWESIDNLTAGLGSPTVQSAVVHGSSGKALKAEAGQETCRRFDPVHAGQQFLIIYFNKANADPGNTLHLYLGKDVLAWPAGPVIRIGDQSGDPGKVGAHNGGDIMQVATFIPGEWHRIRMVVDYDALSYDAYFDGDLVAEGFAFRSNAHDALGWLMIGFDAGAGVQGYYDDIIMGDGDGANVTAVDSSGKLATTWASVKH
ncbi:hypothetical protein ACFL6S_06105 [Candidatus Poribacteria bacterium]